jgi:hypothetical protein
MKQFLLFFGVALIVVLAACSKSSSPTPDNSSGTFKFTSLVANDTVIKVDDVTTLTATATGEGLTYTWTCDFGTFIGSGNIVQWTVCHADNFTIHCTVTDKNNNSGSKNIIIRTHV